MPDRSEKDKMLAGEPYLSADPTLEQERRRAKLLCAEYNQHIAELDRATLTKLLGYETNAWLEPPFYCDYGYNLRLGANVYANHNFTVLDCALVTIGDNTTIGAGSVVTRSIPANAVAYGNPARVARTLDAN